MPDLADFTIRDMTDCTRALRQLGEQASSMEEVAGRVARFFYEQLTDSATHAKSCALVRVFKTHPFSELDPGLRATASRMLPSAPPPGMRCLVLMGTAGDRPAWNARQGSSGHQAIPLPSREFIEQAPMIAQLTRQLGLDPGTLVAGGEGL